MNFDHTDERRMLDDTLRRYIADEYPFETRDRIASSASGYSAAHWRHFGELGVIGALFPERVGGYGGTGQDLALVFEAIGRGLVLEPFLDAVLAGHVIAASPPSAHRDLLDEVIGGNLIVSMAHTEADARHSLSFVTTSATAVAHGWILNGRKAAVQLGHSASHFIVSARTAGACTEENGISLFMVPRDIPGLEIHGHQNIDGGCGADLTFSEVALPAGALLGQPDQAYPTLLHAFGRGVLALCAEALGAMEVAKEATLDYLRTRKQFGVTIGSFQALQHRMVDLLLDIEQVRSAVINAAAALDGPDKERELALSAAKYTASRVGSLVAEECIQLHGGIGMTWELPLAHYAKRLVMIGHQFGDEDYHLQRYMDLSHA